MSRTTPGSQHSRSRLAITGSRDTENPRPSDIKIDLPQSVDREELDFIVEGVTLARDLINTPANDMGPDELEGAGAKARDAQGREIFEHASAMVC